MITRTRRLLDRMIEEGQFEFSSNLTRNQVLKAAQECPVDVIAFLYHNETKMNAIPQSWKVKKDALAFASTKDNSVWFQVSKGDTVQPATVIHESVHIARPLFEEMGLWQKFEDFILKVGENIWETAKRISKNREQEKSETMIKAADRVLALGTGIVTAKHKIAATKAALYMRSRTFVEGCLMIYQSPMHTVDNWEPPAVDYHLNARWMGQCLVAYLGHTLGRNLTKWKDKEEAVCEWLSYDVDVAAEMFKRLRNRLSPTP